jgi:hypothetical protein
MARKKWADLSKGQQTAMLVAGSIQLSLAATAYADLVTRDPEELNGSKGKWAAIIAINFVGPIAYFARGRRREVGAREA